MKKNRKIIKILLILIIFAYTVFVFINQQKTLNEYAKKSESLQQQIADEESNNKELNQKKDDVNSLEFIEEMAREKLDMYYPNEKVYMDQGM